MRPWAVGLALALTACAPSAVLPKKPVPVGAGVAVTAIPVPFNPADLAQTAIGDFTYAGGLVLTSTETSRLHGLSDLVVRADGSFVAVSDDGDLLRARLVLDKAGRLAGVTDAKVSGLADLDGRPLQGKVNADSEGLAFLGKDLIVSFERRNRVWLYPSAGGPPRALPSPEEAFPENGGMEALAADPAAGPDAYIAGGEDSGKTWSCRASRACVPGPTVAKSAEFGLVAMRRLAGGETAYLLRAWDPARGNRVSLVIMGAKGETARLDLARPYTIDNFEGLSALPLGHGVTRFYLISDDNFESRQRTLLVALDWKPKS